MTKYKNKYRIESTRLPEWDYGSNAAYFVTICTNNRIHYFGEIIDHKMKLTDIGKMAEKYWHEIPQHFPFVKLGAFVVMPNHVHGIIIIDKPDDEQNESASASAYVETQNFASLHQLQSQQQFSSKNQFGPQSKNLASIIRGYKIGVTKNARKIDPGFTWQSRYYEHIIRNIKSFSGIENYIITNPLRWLEDEHNM